MNDDLAVLLATLATATAATLLGIGLAYAAILIHSWGAWAWM